MGAGIGLDTGKSQGGFCIALICKRKMVGDAGFEPATPAV